MNLKPSAIAMLAGGGVLFIATFLNWRSSGPFSANGLDTDFHGLLGVFTMLIGLAVAGVVAAREFGKVTFPDAILGFTVNQMIVKLGFAAFLMTFGMQFADSAAFGVTLAWLASAAIAVGGILAMREAAAD